MAQNVADYSPNRTEDFDLGLGVIVTASGSSQTLDIGAFKEAKLFVNVYNLSGTAPNMTINLMDSVDGIVFLPVYSFTAVTTAVAQSRGITNFARYIRMDYVVTGTTPSFTYDITGIAKS